MKKCIQAFLLICLFSFKAFSQIQPAISSKPEERTETDSVSKTDPVEIRKAFFSTFYQKGEPLPASLIREVVAGNPLATREMQLARRSYLASIAVNTAGSFLVAFPIASAIVGGDVNWRYLALGAGLIGTGIPLTKAYFRHAGNAAAIHNQSLSGSVVPKPHLQLGLAGQGIGVHFKF